MPQGSADICSMMSATGPFNVVVQGRDKYRNVSQTLYAL
jgi:hypothetical protein